MAADQIVLINFNMNKLLNKILLIYKTIGPITRDFAKRSKLSWKALKITRGALLYLALK